jgi:hypothetical protein
MKVGGGLWGVVANSVVLAMEVWSEFGWWHYLLWGLGDEGKGNERGGGDERTARDECR